MSDLIVLTAKDVDSLVSKLDLEAALRSQGVVFEAYSNPSQSEIPAIQTPQRLNIQSEKATSLFMPARVAGTGTACKVVSIPRNGGSEGLPATTLVMDDEGKVRGIVNARKLTALRNACGESSETQRHTLLTAGSAVFLRACPTTEPSTNLVVFGSGAQAHSHASVFVRLFPSIKNVTFAVRSKNDRATSLVDSLQKAHSNVDFSLAMTLNSDGSKADLSVLVRAANIIVTVTSSTEALFPSSAVSPGTRLVLVGSYTPKMREIDDDLVRRAGIIVVDSKEACGHEAGELISAGIKDDQLIELGTLVNDPDAAKTAGKGGDVVIFKSVSSDFAMIWLLRSSANGQVGLGIQDVAIAKLVFDDAEKKSIGSKITGYDISS